MNKQPALNPNIRHNLHHHNRYALQDLQTSLLKADLMPLHSLTNPLRSSFPSFFFRKIDTVSLHKSSFRLIESPDCGCLHSWQQVVTRCDQVVTQVCLELVPLLVLGVEHEFVRGAGVVLGLVGHLLRPLLQLADLLASLDEGRVGLAHLARGADALRLMRGWIQS